MKRIIYENQDGTIGVIHPTDEYLAQLCTQIINEKTDAGIDHTGEEEQLDTLMRAYDAVAQKDVPAGLPYWIVDTDTIPSDRTFRNAWKRETDGDVHTIGVDIDKAKEHCHGLRRVARSAEFAPLDIKATIPSEAEAAELDRIAIRAKYSDIQIKIDSANNSDELKAIVDEFEL